MKGFIYPRSKAVSLSQPEMATIHHHHLPLLHNPTPSAFKPKILCKNSKNDAAFVEKKSGFVDYDKGIHHVSTQVSGIRKDQIPQRYRIRVQGDRFQKDWSVSQVVQKVLELDHKSDDVEGLLNRWVGRFARKNFPLLIKVNKPFSPQCLSTFVGPTLINRTPHVGLTMICESGPL